MKWVTAWIAAWTILLLSSTGLSQEDNEEAEVEIVSQLDGWLANCEALTSFDLLLTEETFELTPSGQSKEAICKRRMIADFVSRRFLFVGSRVFETGNSTDTPMTVNTYYHAFCYDPSKDPSAWQRDLPRRPQKLVPKDMWKSLGSSEFYDIRYIGLLPELRTYSSDGTFEESFRTMFNFGKTIWERNATSAVTEICVDVPVKGVEGFLTRCAIVYDLENFVPLKRTTTMVHTKWIRDVSKESYVWEEFNGVRLPVQVHGEKSKAEKIDGKNVSFVAQYDYRLDWRSVNQGFPSGIEASPQTLQDTEKLLQMLEPAQSP